MKLSKEFKLIAGFLLVLLVAVISSVYHIDFNKYLNNFNNDISNTSKTTKKMKVKFKSCIDGDTFKLEENNIVYTYRLLGINTKEDTNIKEEYGEEATKYTCNKLKEAKNIYVSYEKSSSHIDKYKRHLVWVFIDDKMLQEELLKEGLAEVKYIYTKLTYLDRLYKAQDIAIKNRLNIFSNYKEKKYKDNTYTVIFKNDNKIKEVTVKEGNRVSIINNPKSDTLFNGWMQDDSLFDMSNVITSDIILNASFDKR